MDKDKELIVRLKKGESAAFSEVYKNTFPMVVKIVNKNSGSLRDAKDLMQESIFVFIKNLRKNDFELTVKPSTYVYSVARNKWLMQLRGKGREVLTVDDEDQYIPLSNELVQELDHSEKEEKYKAIENAMLKIGEKCKRIILAFYYKKIPLLEIAEEEGLTAQSIKVTKFRCMKKLKDYSFA